MKRGVLLVPVLLFLFSGIQAQQRTIKGEVLEFSNNQPIAGATIVGGQGIGTTTDEDGAFSLKVPKETESIQISFIGYETKDVPLDTSSFYNILLKTSENSLTQLVVVGYGTQRKSDLTGAVSTVDVEKAFDSKPLIDVTKGLQGVVPG